MADTNFSPYECRDFSPSNNSPPTFEEEAVSFQFECHIKQDDKAVIFYFEAVIQVQTYIARVSFHGIKEIIWASQIFQREIEKWEINWKTFGLGADGDIAFLTFSCLL